MKQRTKNMLRQGVLWLAVFVVWTVLIRTVDVAPMGQTGANIGFSGLNGWFHRMTGVHMGIYVLTDWLGLVPVLVCMIFGILGLLQWIRRKSLGKVDGDLVLLGVYYGVVIFCYLVFERFPINYRPIFIEGRAEASYPSSTTLLVLSVMPTLVFQLRRRCPEGKGRSLLIRVSMLFALGMVLGRMVCGVHWITDILGAVFLSAGLFRLYRGAVLRWGEGRRFLGIS